MVSFAKPLKIVYFGTSEFSVPILERLRADKDFEIVEVVTQPDKPVGRRHALNAPPIKRAAETRGLKVWQPKRLKDEAALSHLRDLGADLYVVVAYGKLLPKTLLELPPHGAINVHGSLLPKYRGASPISAAIAAGEKETGVTIMAMNEKLDEGPILAATRVPIGDDDTPKTLGPRLAAAGADLLGPTLKLYAANELRPTPQNHAEASYANILTREDGRIDWSKSAEELERHVRAMQPWPLASFAWKRRGKAAPLKIIVRKVSILHPDSKCDTVGRPGSICRLNDGRMGANCGRGSLLLLTVQLEGKKETDGASFLNGHPEILDTSLN